MDLYFHIGLHKTASTTLQHNIFPMFSHYYAGGSRGGRSDSQPATTAFFQGELAAVWRKLLADFVRKMAKERVQKLLISHEKFSVLRPELPGVLFSRDFDQYRGSNFSWLEPQPPLINWLEACLALPEVDRVRVILFLRKQPEWLASLYAEESPQIRAPGQRDFENKVRLLIARNDPNLAHSELVTALHQALGTTDVKVLFHEDGLESNIAGIEDFMSVRFGATGPLKTPLNEKKRGVSKWVATEELPLTAYGGLGTARKTVYARILSGFDRPWRQLRKPWLY